VELQWIQEYDTLVKGNTWQIQQKAAQAGFIMTEVKKTDACITKLSSFEDGLGYYPRGFHNSDSTLRATGGLSHIFKLPGDGVKAAFPLRWSFDLAYLTNPKRFTRSFMRRTILMVLKEPRIDVEIGDDVDIYQRPGVSTIDRTTTISFSSFSCPYLKYPGTNQNKFLIELKTALDNLALMSMEDKGR